MSLVTGLELTKEGETGRRLVATLSSSGNELTLELEVNDVACEETIASGVVLDRAADGRPLPLRLTGLHEPCRTNLYLSRAIT